MLDPSKMFHEYWEKDMYFFLVHQALSLYESLILRGYFDEQACMPFRIIIWSDTLMDTSAYYRWSGFSASRWRSRALLGLKTCSLFQGQSCWALGNYRMIRFFVIESHYRANACFYLSHWRTRFCCELQVHSQDDLVQHHCKFSMYIPYRVCKSSKEWNEKTTLSVSRFFTSKYCCSGLLYSIIFWRYLPRRSW